MASIESFAALEAALAAAVADREAALAALASKDAALASKDAALAAALAENALLQAHAASGRLMAVNPTIPSIALRSPTKTGADSLLGDTFTGFLGAPISLRIDPAIGQSFAGIFMACEKSPVKLMQEKTFYELAVEQLPPFAELLDKRGNTVYMYGAAGHHTSRYSFTTCFPELRVRGRGHRDAAVKRSASAAAAPPRAETPAAAPASARAGRRHAVPAPALVLTASSPAHRAHSAAAAPAPARAAPAVCITDAAPSPAASTGAESAEAPRGPGFGGEIKSVDEVMIGQGLYYGLMDLAGIFFPVSEGVPENRCFYKRPPVGYVLLGFPHVAYFAAIELVGKAIVSPVSQPFFLGSAEHASAAASLPCESIGAPVWFLDRSLKWTGWAGAPPIQATGRFRSPASDALTSSTSVSLTRRARPSGRATPASAVAAAAMATHASLGSATSSHRSSTTAATKASAHSRAASEDGAAGVEPSDNTSASSGPTDLTSASTDSAHRGALRTMTGRDARRPSGPEPPVSVLPATATLPRPADHSVCWARNGDKFLKLVRGDARTAEQFRGMHRAYDLLSGVLMLGGRPPELGATARLLYGQHEVLVEMAFAEGAECTDAEVTLVDGAVMQGVARAIAWLALHRIIYTDLRGPNVLKCAGRGNSGSSATAAAALPSALAAATAAAIAVTLIDFDDCHVANVPVTSLEGYVASLLEYCDEQLTWPLQPLSRTFAEEFIAGAFPELRKALETAFKSLAAPLPVPDFAGSDGVCASGSVALD